MAGGRKLFHWPVIRTTLAAAILLAAAPDPAHRKKTCPGFSAIPGGCSRSGRSDTLRQSDTLWLLTLGQSNAANSGEAPRRHPAGGLQLLPGGSIYPARDPLLGASGRGSNVWTAVAAELIRRDIAKRVVPIPLAVGATSIAEWRSDGRVGRALADLLTGLKADGITADFVLWQQGGESDEALSSRDYSGMLLQLRGGLAAPPARARR